MYYKYSVLTETCSVINGVEEGVYLEIRKRLLEKGHHILSIKPLVFKSIRSSLERKKINSRTLSVFFYDLASRIKIGLNINEGIMSLENASTEPVLTRALGKINEDLSFGLSLAEACRETGCFPELSLNALNIGEKTGDLERVFTGLSLHYSREAEFRIGLKNAILYPFVIFCLLIGVMLYVSVNVIPHLEGLLPTGENAYFATKTAFILKRDVKEILVCLFYYPGTFRFCSSKIKNSVQEKLSSFYYRIPVIGKILKDIALACSFQI